MMKMFLLDEPTKDRAVVLAIMKRFEAHVEGAALIALDTYADLPNDAYAKAVMSLLTNALGNGLVRAIKIMDERFNLDPLMSVVVMSEAVAEYAGTQSLMRSSKGAE